MNTEPTKKQAFAKNLRRVMDTPKRDLRDVARLRVTVAALLVCLAFLGLGAHLYRIQCVEHDNFLELRNKQTVSVETVSGRRGSIFDRNGRPLALSRLVSSVYAVPGEVQDKETTASALAQVLGTETQSVRAKLDTPPDERLRHFVWIKRKIPQEQADRIASLGLPGIAFRQEYKRSYLMGKLACHVLGFTNIDEKGMEGVEAVYDKQLRGRTGSFLVLRDAVGRNIMPPNGNMQLDPPCDGMDVFLTIDLVMQQILEEELDALCVKWTPAGVTGIVMDPYSGDILALANRPAFDPNEPAAYPEETRRNRAVTDPIEPGSTFKPFIMGPVLQENLVSLFDHINCENGVFCFRGRKLRDATPHGVLTVEEVLTKSSNIGMAKLGMLLATARGRTVMRDYLRLFDFGARTDAGLMPAGAESPGKITSLRDWSDYTTTSVPMGHEISVTSLQLLKGYCALANGGVLMRPRILRATAEPGTQVNPEDAAAPAPIRRVLKPQAFQKLFGALCNVVSKGTGTKAALPYYRVAGKTGTAQKLLPDGRYSHDKHVGLFAGFAPAERPRVVVLIVVDEPKGAYYGGTVAAPSVGRTIERCLKYLGESPVRTAECGMRNAEFGIGANPSSD